MIVQYCLTICKNRENLLFIIVEGFLLLFNNKNNYEKYFKFY